MNIDQTIQHLINQNSEEIDNLSDLFDGWKESFGADPLRIDLEEFSFATIDESTFDNHPLYDITGNINIEELEIKGVFLVHEDANRIDLFAVLYLDEKQQLRAYVPRNGNAFNPINGKPFGEGGYYNDANNTPVNEDDDSAARTFGYTDYADFLHHLPSDLEKAYNKKEILEDLNDTFRNYIKPKGV